MKHPKRPLSPQEQQILDVMLKDIEGDMRRHIYDMSPQELEAYVDDERQEATAEQFADFMQIVNDIIQKKYN